MFKKIVLVFLKMECISYILDKSVFSLIQKQKLWFNPILTEGGIDPSPYRSFAITQKVFRLRSSNFLAFLTNTCPSLKA